MTDGSGGDDRDRSIDLLAENADSVIDLPALTSFVDLRATEPTGWNRWSTLTARYGGLVRVNADNSDVQGVSISLGAHSTLQGSPQLLSNSKLEGGGLIQGDVINAGQIAPRGLLTIDGNLTQMPQGKLAIGIGGRIPGETYDVLQVTGAAQLGGTFSAALRDGFVARDGDSFRVLNFASRSGDFATYSGLDLGAGVAAHPELALLDLSLVVGFSTGPAVLQVVLSTEDPAIAGASIDVLFDESVDPATFEIQDVQLVGPAGAVQILAIEPTDTLFTTFRLSVNPDQFINGQYQLAIGPDVRDFVGNPMNQDRDGTNGELEQDRYETLLEWQIDRTGPQALQMTPSGWTNQDVTTLQVEFSEAIQTATLTREDLQLTGPSGSIDLSTVRIEMLSARSVQFQIPRLATDGEYQVTLGPQITDLSGNAMAAEYTASFTMDKTRPAVVSFVPTGPVYHAVEKLQLKFDSVIDVSSFTVDDFLLTGPLGRIPARSIEALQSDTFEILLPATLTAGHFAVSVGPDIRDLAGNALAAAYDQTFSVELADLAVMTVTGPERLIGDPALLSVSWTVQNVGTGQPSTASWDDAIILSVDRIAGNSDDRVVGQFRHTGELSASATYTRSEAVLLPPGLTGRFYLLVQTDAAREIDESGSEANNVAGPAHVTDVMPLPYADLVIESVAAPATAWTGAELDVSWTVANRGIGITSSGRWYDDVYLTRDAAGQQQVSHLGRFEHLGQLAVDGQYTRTGRVQLAPGLLPGTYYFAVATGGPFEFIYQHNNSAVSSGITVTAAPTVDLVMSNVVAPASAAEGTAVDVSWTVTNSGTVDAIGGWSDRLFLRQPGNPAGALVPLGTYRFVNPLASGGQYTRTERVSLPREVTGTFELVVETNADRDLFEGEATANNAAAAPGLLSVTVQPRPDLQVTEVLVPSRVASGGSLAAEFVVTNRGTLATSTPIWTDRVYLSLDGSVTRDDILIAELANPSALEPDQSYRSATASVTVPLRYRGEMFVLVVTDIDNRVDEWPGERNNTTVQPIYIDPVPLPDLVVGDVVGPSQAVGGAQVEVRYTVTNRGSGPTSTALWTEMIWLTRDRNRPHPGAQYGDILLATRQHEGALPINAGYDVVTQVTLPENLAAGTYYIMPWTDPYDQVPEDTLASNINPDDPNEIDNNNYKARALDLIAQLPDLVVNSVTTDRTSYQGGDQILVRWTVRNPSTGAARPGGWVDRVYVSSHADPFDDAAHRMILGEVHHATPVNPGQEYSESLAVRLSPSAAGQFIVVVSDAREGDDPEGDDHVLEVREDNNARAIDVRVQPTPADLIVSNVRFEPQLYSGEPTTIRYTVTNAGAYPVYSGTEYWRDFVWLSADPEFIRTRATYLGDVAQRTASRCSREKATTWSCRPSCPKVPAATTSSTSTRTRTTTTVACSSRFSAGSYKPAGGRQTPGRIRAGCPNSSAGRSKIRPTTCRGTR